MDVRPGAVLSLSVRPFSHRHRRTHLQQVLEPAPAARLHDHTRVLALAVRVRGHPEEGGSDFQLHINRNPSKSENGKVSVAAGKHLPLCPSASLPSNVLSPAYLLAGTPKYLSDKKPPANTPVIDRRK